MCADRRKSSIEKVFQEEVKRKKKEAAERLLLLMSLVGASPNKQKKNNLFLLLFGPTPSDAINNWTARRAPTSIPRDSTEEEEEEAKRARVSFLSFFLSRCRT